MRGASPAARSNSQEHTSKSPIAPYAWCYTFSMRTLDDIIPPSRKRTVEPLSQPATQPPREPLRYDRPPRFPYTTIIAILFVIAASAGALLYFSSAKVEVTPNSVTAEIQGSLTATLSAGDLPFEIITAEKIASQSVKAAGTKAVTSAASGSITIYNIQPQAQRLVANTRFATPAGLIFRIKSPVTIPGGTTAKPGTVTAKVFADQPGSSYNVGPTSFTIPGFKGTPQETLVYAKSSAAMTGGASGNMPVVDPAVAESTKQSLTTALAPDLAASLQAKVPEGYVLLPGAAETSYQELSPEPSATTGMVEVRQQGTMTAVVFPNTALAKAIAASVSGLGYQGEPVSLSPASTLTLTPEDGIPAQGAASFTFSLAGKANLIYVVDPTRVQAAVSGKTRSAAEVALTNYPEVKRAIIILRPFWRQTFPQDPAAITVEVQNS